MKKILITGADSYIGMSVENWLMNCLEEYCIDTLDMRNSEWKKYEFSGYDIIFHVAGIAHADVGNVTEEQKKMYYDVNTTLAIEVAKKAKQDGVKQFIMMSSMIIYGDSAGLNKSKVITNSTVPVPANFYGDSKWQADIGVRQIETDIFKVVVIRPPMIYGKGSKGNYPLLSKMAKKLPMFPNLKNERSMLHIDNLCEFIHLMIENEERGIFFPQNSEYTRTSEMVKMIARENQNHIYVTVGLNWVVKLASLVPGRIGGMVHKAFGNLTYDMTLSEYKGYNYRVRTLIESIHVTEN